MRFQDTLHKPTNTPQHTLWHVAFSTNYVGSSGTPLTMQRLAFLKDKYAAGAQGRLFSFPPPKVPAARFTMAEATCAAEYSWVC